MPASLRYDRQVRHWGREKQKLLESATVLVAGIGGLGATVSELLVRAGIRKLWLIDNGRVDWPDLNRQLLYTEAEVGRNKVESAAERLRQINSKIELELWPCRINSAFRIPAGISLVADCLDNYTGRFALESALAQGTVLVHGGVEGDQGQVLTLIKGASQPLAEIFAGACRPAEPIPVTGASAAIIAGLMVHEITNALFGRPQLLDRCLVVSLTDLHMSFLPV